MPIRIAALLLAAGVLFGCGGGTHAPVSLPAPSSNPTITISPATASVAVGASLHFSAEVTGAGPVDPTVVWSASEGTMAPDGTYTAPNAPGTFTVRAAYGNLTASARVAVTAAPPPANVTVAIIPSTVSLQVGATRQFSATVTGGSDSGVTWTASAGSITSAGLFTAPATAGAVTITATSQGDPTASATAQVTVTAAAAPPASNPSGGRLFSSSAANWLYSPPTGPHTDISATLVKDDVNFSINAAPQFGYPVQYTDGTHGCTTFTDTRYYGYKDKICVPKPANGFWPSLGGWGYNDGHLIVVNTQSLQYYDFWKLLTDGNGNPTSTNVGKVVTGSLTSGDGTPGTTAANITGLAGDILPGELDCEDCLQHAVNVIVPGNMNSPALGDQGPAHISDGGVQGGLFREGAKIRFDPTINVDSLPASTAIKALMKALQKYGGLITDQTGANAICYYSALPSPPKDQTGKQLINEHLWIYY